MVSPFSLVALLATGPVVRWTAPDGCPGVDAILARVREFGVEPPELELVGDVLPASEGTFVLTVSVAGGGARSYVAADCHKLTDVAALLLAAAADPVQLARNPAFDDVDDSPPPPSEARGDVPSPAKAEGVGVVPEARRPPRPRRDRATGSVALVGLAGAAQLPGVDLGTGLVFGVGVAAARFELRTAYLAPRSARVPTSTSATISISAWDIAPVACGVLGRRSLHAVLCGGAEVGIMHARGDGFTHRRAGLAPWVALLAAPRLEWTLGRWRLFAGVELLVAVARGRFAARNVPAASVVSGTGGLRAVLGFAAQFGSGRPRRSNRPQPET